MKRIYNALIGKGNSKEEAIDIMRDWVKQVRFNPMFDVSEMLLSEGLDADYEIDLLYFVMDIELKYSRFEQSKTKR